MGRTSTVRKSRPRDAATKVAEHRLCEIIDPERDSLRFYMLGANWRRRVEHVGAKPATDFDGPLIF